MAFAGAPVFHIAASFCPSRIVVYFLFECATRTPQTTPFIILMAYKGLQYVI